MVTGDAEAVAATVAAELGIDRYYARVLPQDKARIVADLQQEGATAFVGDGSTMPPRCSPPISGWRSEPAPTSPSNPPI